LIFEGWVFRCSISGGATPQFTLVLPEPPDSFCDIIAAFCFAPVQWDTAGRRICFGELHMSWNSHARVCLQELSLPYQQRASKRFQVAATSLVELQVARQTVLRPNRRGDSHP